MVLVHPSTTTLNQEFSVNGGTVNLGSCTGYTQYVSNVSNSGGHTGTYYLHFQIIQSLYTKPQPQVQQQLKLHLTIGTSLTYMVRHIYPTPEYIIELSI